MLRVSGTRCHKTFRNTAHTARWANASGQSILKHRCHLGSRLVEIAEEAMALLLQDPALQYGLIETILLGELHRHVLRERLQ